jgi:hypothetical protein
VRVTNQATEEAFVNRTIWGLKDLKQLQTREFVKPGSNVEFSVPYKLRVFPSRWQNLAKPLTINAAKSSSPRSSVIRLTRENSRLQVHFDPSSSILD